VHDHHPTAPDQHADHRGAPDWPDTTDPQEFWDGMYESRDKVWSGRPNAALVDELSGATPGRALDLGCGEGGDAIWLAEQGWTVLGVDVSRTALERTAAHARERGVTDRIELEHHDLAESFPEGSFDLVSAPFFQSPLEFPREQILRRALRSIAAGGQLLIISHAEAPSWAPDAAKHVHFPTVDETLRELALDDDWVVETAETRARATTGPDGEPAELLDLVVRVRRAA
jgi:SAM-dependent methyltransferase